MKRVVEAHLGEVEEFGFGEAHACGVLVFVVKRGVKHGGIVGGEDDRDAVAEELRKRMFFNRWGHRAIDYGARVARLQVFEKGAGAEIALRADFEGNAAVGEEIHERGILGGGYAMADPFNVEKFDSFADFFRTADFAGVDKQVQAVCSSLFVDGTKFVGGDAEFVSADAEGDNFLGGASLGDIHNLHRWARPELTHGIEDPVEAQAAPFEWLSGLEDRFEIGFRPLLAQQHDADRESHFCIDNVLGEEMFG